MLCFFKVFHPIFPCDTNFWSKRGSFARQSSRATRASEKRVQCCLQKICCCCSFFLNTPFGEKKVLYWIISLVPRKDSFFFRSTSFSCGSTLKKTLKISFIRTKCSLTRSLSFCSHSLNFARISRVEPHENSVELNKNSSFLGSTRKTNQEPIIPSFALCGTAHLCFVGIFPQNEFSNKWES